MCRKHLIELCKRKIIVAAPSGKNTLQIPNQVGKMVFVISLPGNYAYFTFFKKNTHFFIPISITRQLANFMPQYCLNLKL
ncbi:MAG: hypothetical protein MUF24_07805, partial [Chitinophagaceae bacterium]|nr:hypothetical protein [Chitinophagaceae bacterium]